MSKQYREYWVPEDFVYLDVGECLRNHPEQAAQLMRGDSVKLDYQDLEAKLQVAIEAIRSEYEDYYKWIDEHSFLVTAEYTDCIANLSKALATITGDSE